MFELHIYMSLWKPPNIDYGANFEFLTNLSSCH